MVSILGYIKRMYQRCENDCNFIWVPQVVLVMHGEYVNCQAPPRETQRHHHEVPVQQVDDEDDTYEQKSVRDIKQMFSKPSRPLSFG